MNARHIGSVLLAALLAWAAPAAAQRISVDGASLTRDGAPWLMRGVTVVGLLPPAPSPYPAYAAAQAHWGTQEIQAIKAFGADTIRFQLSQPGLDPQSPLGKPTYQQRVLAGIALARQAGLVVVLSMQWQGGAGQQGIPSLPNDATTRAWLALAPHVANDPGIILELFNEPAIKVDQPRTAQGFAEVWQRWQAAFQPLVTAIRTAAPHNVLLLDGAQASGYLAGAPALNDPARQLAYAVHPYFHQSGATPEMWQKEFGDFARTHPVVAGEWNVTSSMDCTPDAPARAAALLAWLHDHRMGLVGWAMDWPGSLVQDFSYIPTNFDDFACNPTHHNGAGALISAAFHQQR